MAKIDYTPAHWYVCDGKDGVCVHSQRSLERLTSSVPRCIRHGSILTYQRAYDGMSRTQVRGAMRDALQHS
jgi:hypothetical protein